MSKDEDRCYVSAMAFMTGMYPNGLQKPLFKNQSENAIPPIEVYNIDQIIQELNDYPLYQNIQTIPIHSNAGDQNSMLFGGLDSNICPILNKI